jgi:hypothetical protein
MSRRGNFWRPSTSPAYVDLPDAERLEDDGLLQRPSTEGALDGILGLACDDERQTDEDAADFADGDGHQSADW